MVAGWLGCVDEDPVLKVLAPVELEVPVEATCLVVEDELLSNPLVDNFPVVSKVSEPVVEVS